jgi:hypothetical protein
MGEIAIGEMLHKLQEVLRGLMESEQAVATYRMQAHALETSLKLLGYKGEIPSQPARARNQVFKAGEISRQVADILRVSPEIAVPRDIAAEILRRNKWDPELWGRVTMAVKECLKRKRKRERHSADANLIVDSQKISV